MFHINLLAFGFLMFSSPRNRLMHLMFRERKIFIAIERNVELMFQTLCAEFL